jgi:CheY-like chemotaxis protein
MATAGLKRALIVDDDRDVIEQVERVLRRCGVTELVHVRRLQAAGAKIAAGERFDLIVVDVEMATLAAGTLLDRIAGGEADSRHVPVLFIAEVKARSDVAALQEAGCHVFLMKPLNDSILEMKFRELSKKTISDEGQQALVREVRECFAMGLFNEAENKIKPVLRRFPASATFQLLLAELFFLRDDLKNARSVLGKVQMLNPDSIEAQVLAERVRARSDEVDAARAAAEEKARVEAMYREAEKLNTQALNFSRSGSLDEAIRLYEGAIEKSEGMPNRHVILFNAAMSNFKAGKFERARELCETSYEASDGAYDKAKTLGLKIAEEEKRRVAAAAAKSPFGEVGGAGLVQEAGKEAQNPLLNPEEEARILKFVMFEGKY